MKARNHISRSIICLLMVVLCIAALSACNIFDITGCDHEWGGWKTTKDATCTAEGVKSRTCDRCGETETAAIKAKGHDWTEATCTTPKTCSVCKKTDGAALGHTYSEEIVKDEALKSAATAESAAVYYKSCVCGAISKSEKDTFTYGSPLEHKHSYTTAVTAPTCTEQGYTTYTCACGDSYVGDKVAALGHRGGKATCTELAKCSVCGTRYGELAEHKWVDATCTKEKYCSACGKTEGEKLAHTGGTATCVELAKCSACGAEYGELLEHSWVDATCTKEKHCSVCGKTEGEKLAHTGGTATCSELAKCSACGAEYGELLEHSWVDATCTKEKHCSVCGKTEGEKLAHTGGTATCIAQAKCDVCGTAYGSFGAHDWKDATCTEAKSCRECGYSEGEALGHTGGTATCVQKAICDRCSMAYGELLEHTYDKVADPLLYLASEATCESAATYYYSCATCGKCHDSENAEVFSDGDKLAHEYVWVSNGDNTHTGTCHNGCGDVVINNCVGGTAACTKKAICEVCQEYYGEVLGHTWVDGDITVAPTCTSAGQREQNCQCGATTTVSVPATDHSYSQSVTEPTCEAQGYTTYTCAGCGHSYAEVIPAIGHNCIVSDTVASTCTTKGYTVYTCQNGCGYSYKADYKDVIDHAFEETSRTEATCTTNGAVSYTCSACGETKTEVLEATGHTEVALEAKGATCTETGLTEGKKCSVCDTVTVEQTIIPVAPHAFGEWVETSATCTTTGSKVRTCQDCGASETETISATGHNYNDVVTAPSCVAGGYTTHTCESCGHTYVDSQVTASGHSWDIAAPTCEQGQTCSVCGATTQALGHSYSISATTAATCTKAATNTYTCANCGVSYTESVGTTIAHNITGVAAELVEKEGALCTFVEHYKCKDCGTDVVGETVEKHEKYTASIKTAATCVTEGVKILTCAACGDKKEESIPVDTTLGHTWKIGTVADGKRTDVCENCGETKTVTVVTEDQANKVEDLKDTELSVGDANINFGDAADSIGNQTENDVTIGAGKIEGDDKENIGLSKEQLEQTGNNPIYNFTVTDTQNNAITEFGEDVYVTISIPYELAEGEDVDSIAIWFINDKGEVESIQATYNNGYVTFKTNHFSYYTVTRLTPAQRCEVYGHNYKESVVAPTCIDGGYTLKYCIRCRHSEKANETAAIGHNYTSKVTKQATCALDGVMTYTCSTCKHSYTEAILATGEHKYEIISETLAGCVTEGVKTEKCATCTSTIITKTEPTGHKYEVTEVIAPKCTEKGYTLYTCHCGASYKGDEVDATGHNFEGSAWNVVTEAKCTTTGLQSRKCADCDAVETKIIPATGHTYSSKTVDPTCTEKGYTLYACSCGASYKGNEVAPTGHNYTSAVTKAATCTETGIETYTCSTCKASYIVIIPAKGHNYQKGETVASTCTEKGYTVYTCDACKDSYKADYTDVIDHTYTSAVTAPTCTNGGYTTHTCENCKQSYVDSYTTPVGHKYDATWTWAADYSTAKITLTCLNEGCQYNAQAIEKEVASECTVFDSTVEKEGRREYNVHFEFDGHSFKDQKTEVIPVKEHSHEGCEMQYNKFNHWYKCPYSKGNSGKIPHEFDEGTVVKEATCKTEGTIVYKCVCGFEKSESIPKNDKHTVSTALYRDGDTHWNICQECGEKCNEALHVWDNGTQTKDVTCTENGIITYRCDCGAAKAEEIPAFGHTEKHLPAVDPTCTESGLTAGVVCETCGEVLVKQEIIEALGHAEVILPGKDATCLEDGITEGKVCATCGEVLVKQEIIKAFGHKEETLFSKDATCTESGLTAGKKCATCGEILVAQQEIAAKGHSFGEWIETIAPTENKAGEKTRYCENCDATETSPIAALGHIHELHPVIVLDAVEPTCTTTGLTAGTKCSDCGEILVSQEIIPALGHTEEIVPGKDATCTETGLTAGVKCAVCGETLKAQEEIPALGHTEETVPGKDATCTETGLTAGVKCAVCGETLKAQEEIPALGHTEETVPGKDATCTEAGLTAGVKCAVCGETLKAQEEIPVLAHTEEIVPGKEAGHLANGLTEGKYCSVCNKTLVEQKEIPAEGHTEEKLAGKDATCTEAGLTEGVWCPVCGEIFVAQETIPTKDHNYVDGVCSDCGATAICDHTQKSEVALNMKDFGGCEWILYYDVCACGEEKILNTEKSIITCEFNDYANMEEGVDENGNQYAKALLVCDKCGMSVEMYATYARENCEATYVYQYTFFIGEVIIIDGVGYTETFERHGEYIYETVRFDEYGTCGGMVEVGKCADCNKVMYYYNLISICEINGTTKSTSETFVDENGITHTIDRVQCSECGYVKTRDSWVEQVDKCYTIEHVSEIILCGEIVIVELEEDYYTGNHTYGEWVEIKAPTCFEGGMKQRECTVCGSTDTWYTSPTDEHTYVDGFCSVCGKEEKKVVSFDEYMAATEGEVVTVRGVVVGINSQKLGNKRNHLFLADTESIGGYYCYGLAVDPMELGVDIGMLVEVTGTVAPYSGMQELKNGTVEIVDYNYYGYDPVDITEIFANGEDLKNYVGLPVTIKGVEIGGQDLEKETSQYLYFELNGRTSYVRTLATDFSSTLLQEDKAFIDAAHAEHYGWTANVTGLLVLYNRTPYLIPMSVDCFEYLEMIEKTPAEKVEDALNEFIIPGRVQEDVTLVLPEASMLYPEVTFVWETNNEAYPVVDNKLIITVANAPIDLVLTLTATCGDVTQTKEFMISIESLNVPAGNKLTVLEAISLGLSMEHNTYTDKKFFVTGEVVEIYNTVYGNMRIADKEGNILTIYGTYNEDGSVRFDAMEKQPAVGDTVTLYGIIGQYNGTPQMKNGWLVDGTYKKAEYNTTTNYMPDTWNVLNFTDNNSSQIIDYIGGFLFDFDYKFAGDKYNADGTVAADAIISGAYTVHYSAASKLEDVTAFVDAKWGYTAEQIAEGGYAWKITLRDDLKWDDGTPITAADFVYSMQAQLDPNVMNYRAYTYYDILGVHNAYNYFFQNQAGTYETVESQGFSSNQEALDAGAVLYLDLVALDNELFGWGFTTAGLVDQNGNAMPMHLAYNDERTFNTPEGWQTGNTDWLLSAADIWGYIKPGAAYSWYCEPGGGYNWVTIYVENTVGAVAWEDVGFYSIDEENAIVICLDKNYKFLTEDGSLTYVAVEQLANLPLVKKDLYEACTPNTYATSLETTASWGPYKLVAFDDYSYRLVKNDNWYGWNMEQYKNQYNVTAINCQCVFDFATQWMGFLAGIFDDANLDTENANDYYKSEYVSYALGNGIFGMQLFSDLDVLKVSGNNNGILAIQEFRNAFNLALNRADIVDTIWPGTCVPSLGLISDLYYYDLANSGVYRDTVEAKEALLRAYGFTQAADGLWYCGELKDLTLDEAYAKLNGYNLDLAREKMAEAIEILVANADYYGYDINKDITIVYGASVDTEKQRARVVYLQNVLNELTAGTLLEGRINIVFDASAGFGWAEAFRTGDTQIGFGYGFTGSTFDPYSIIGVFVDPNHDQNYHSYWDTSAIDMTLTMPEGDYEGAGETITMSLLNWYYCMMGSAADNAQPYTYNWNADNAPANARVMILAALEEVVLKESRSIMLIGDAVGSFLSAKFSYITDEYNYFMGFGGIRYMIAEYTDAEWAEFVASNNGDLTNLYKPANTPDEPDVPDQPEEDAFWLAGVLHGKDHWDCESGIKFEKINDTTYIAYYTFTEADTADWMSGYVGACKAVYGHPGEAPYYWYGNPENGDNVNIDSYGTYELIFTVDPTNIQSGYLTATKIADIPTGPVKVTIDEAYNLEDGTEVILSGVVTEINTAWSDIYGNISVTITDANGSSFYIYRLCTFVELGDEIEVTGKIGSYKGQKQIAQGSTAVIIKEANPDTPDIPDHEHVYEDGKCLICGLIPVFENASVYDNDGDGVNESYFFTPILPEKFTADGAVHVWAGDYIADMSSSYVSSAEFNGIRHWYCTEGNGEFFTIKVTVDKAGIYEMAVHMRMKDNKERGAKYIINEGTANEYSFETSYQFATNEDVYAAWENDYTMSSYMFGIYVELQAGDNYITIEQSSKSPKSQHFRDFYFVKASDTPDIPASGSVSSSIFETAIANGWENGIRYESFDLGNGFIVSATGTPNGNYELNTGKYYSSSNTWRFYQAENPVLTITAPDGTIIVSVKITYESVRTGILTYGDLQIESDTVITVNGNVVTFGVGNTGDVTNGQVRITAIEVYYAEAETCKHEYTEIERVEPTCTIDGSITYTCSLCGKNTVEILPALGHAFGEWVETKAPTCTEYGEMSATCTVCGAVETVLVPAFGHTLGEWVETKAPTCTENGEISATCSVCAEIVTEYIPAFGHSYKTEPDAVVGATCAEDGYEIYYCIACNYENKINTPKTNHVAGEDGVCVYCDAYRLYDLVWNDNQAAKVNTQNPPTSFYAISGWSVTNWIDRETLPEGAVLVVKSSVWVYPEMLVDKNKNNARPARFAGPVTVALDDAWWNDYTTLAILCNSGAKSAIEVWVPVECKHEYTEIERVEPTCTTDGYVTTVCGLCEKVKTTVLPALGHTFGEWTEIKAPTCAENGEMSATCTVCGAIETMLVPALGHALGEWVETKAPTCALEGEVSATCTTCGSVVTGVLPATGKHTYVDGYCSVCGISEHEHVYEDGKCLICGKIPVFENASVYDNDSDGVNEVYYFTPLLPEQFQSEDVVHVWAGDYVVDMSSYVTSAEFNGIRHWYVTENSGEFFTIKVTVDEAGTYEMAIHMRMKDSKERGTKYTVNAGTEYEYSFETSFQFATDEDAYAARENDYTMSSYMFGIFVELQAGDNYIKIEQSSKSPKCQHYRDFYFVGINTCEHEYTEIERVEPTCTTEGYVTKICGLCAKVKTTSIPALGHIASEWVEVVAPGCTTEGVLATICTVCGETVTEIIPAHGHIFGNYTETVVPTCTEYGEWMETCSVCGETQSGLLYPLGHAHEYKGVTKEPTCTAYGEETYTCHCGDSYTNRLPMYGHNYVDGVCASCGEVKFVIPAFDTILSVADANKVGIEFEHNQYSTGKFFVVGVVDSIANTRYGNLYIRDAEGNLFYIYGTYSANGGDRFDYMKNQPVVGDTIVVYGVIGQYAGSPQMKNAWMMANLGTVEHTFGEWTYVKAPTCTEAGEISTTCTTCGEVVAVAIPATGHIYKYQGITKEPTCTENGEELYACQCGDSYTNVIWAYGHSLTDVTITKEPTCTVEGEQVGTCSRCGETITEAIGAKGHNEVSERVNFADLGISCGGYVRIYTCTVCGENSSSTIREYCSWQNVGTDEATGATIYTCRYCGAEKHQLSEKQYTDACHYVTVETREYYVGGELVISAANRMYGESHEWKYEFTLNGTSCDEGYTVKQTCENCDYLSESTGYGHGHYHIASYDLTKYGACYGYVELYSCPCGESKWNNVSCCVSHYVSSDSYVDEAGITHNVEVYGCSTCGLVRETDYYTAREGCYQYCYYTYTYKMGDTEIVSYVEKSHMNTYHVYEYTYTFADENNKNCEAGVTVTRKCKNCEYSYEDYRTYHSNDTFFNSDAYDFCSNHNVNVYGCPCGRDFYVEFNDYTFEYDEEKQLYVCAECGLTVSRVTEVVEDGCVRTEKVNFVATLSDAELYSCARENTYPNHNYGGVKVSTANGNTVLSAKCSKCGDEVTLEMQEVVLENHDGIYYYDYVFTPEVSGQYTIQSYTDRDTYVTLYELVGEQMIELGSNDDGASNAQFRLVSTLTAGKTYVYRIRFLNNSYDGTISYTLSQSATAANGSCKHNSNTYFAVLPEGVTSCEDGAYSGRVCPECGKLDEVRLNTSHNAYRVAYYDFAQYGACYGYIEAYSCACGYNSYVYSHYCAYSSISSETYVDEAGIKHTLEVYQCPTCGLTRTRDYYDAKEGCYTYRYYTESYAIGETEIGSASWKSHRSTNHDYEYTYTFADENNKNCEYGVTVVSKCKNCDYTSESYYAHHVSLRKEYIDFTEYGACYGYLEFYECPCGESKGQNVNYCANSTVSNETITDENGVAHTIRVYQCPTCGLTRTRDESYVTEGCYTYRSYVYTFTMGETALGSYTTKSLWSENHNYEYTYTFADENNKNCEAGVTVIGTCKDCGNSFENYQTSHSSNRVTYYDFTDYGADGGYAYVNECPCGYYTYVEFSSCSHGTNYNTNEYTDEEGIRWHVQTWTTSCDCDIRFDRAYRYEHNTDNCTRTTYYEESLTVGAALLELGTRTTTEVYHEYETRVELMEGATDCSQGVIVTNGCRYCDAGSSHNVYYHYNAEIERFDLSEYGSVCGGYAVINGCACGYNRSLSLNADCSFDHRSTVNWVEGTINGSQETAYGYRSFYSNSYTYTCAVTDPVQCGFVIRYSTYWRHNVEDCTATKCLTVQFGYDEATDTCQFEKTYELTNQIYTYHNYERTQLDHGYIDTCSVCGSYYSELYYYNEQGVEIKYERIWENKLDDGYRKYREETREDVGSYEGRWGNYTKSWFYKYVEADGTESWNKREYSYADYEAPFGENGYIRTERYTDHTGSDYTYEYAYTYYKGYEFPIYDHYTNGDYWRNYDYTYDFTDGCKRWDVYTTSDGENSESGPHNAHPTYYSKTVVPPTCTQFGVRAEYCPLCEKSWNEYSVQPVSHNWIFLSDNLYYCRNCGLQNINGANGDIVMEDLTDKYGNGEAYVIGYWMNTTVRFTPYVTIFLNEPIEIDGFMEEAFVLFLLDEQFHLVEDPYVGLYVTRADIEAAVAMLCQDYGVETFAPNSYVVSISFVPDGADDNFDYAIVFDDLAGSEDADNTITDDEFVTDYFASNEYVEYTILPEDFAEWAITIYGNNWITAYLYDGEGNQLNFYNQYSILRINRTLEAGKTYVLRVQHEYSHQEGYMAIEFNKGHVHTLEIIPAVEPTCTNSGLTEGKRCTECGSTFVYQEYVPSLGHTAEDWVIEREPTCNNWGYRYAICTRCNQNVGESISPLPCNYGEWITIHEPTCTESGYKEAICATCGGAMGNYYGEPLGHDFVDDTCTRCGAGADEHRHSFYEGKCSICGYTPVVGSSSAYDHDGNGEYEYYYFTPVLPEKYNAEGAVHVWAGDYVADMTTYVRTSTSGGIQYWYVSGYSDYVTYKVTVAEAGTYEMAIHLRLNSTSTRSAEFTVNAGTENEYSFETSYTFYDSNDYEAARYDNYTYTSYMFGIYVELQAGDNYIQIGRSDYGLSYMYFRDFYFTKVEEGHNYVETERVEAGCFTDGYVVKTCETCGESIQEFLKARGHVYGDWVEIKAPTCTEYGEQVATCTDCGATTHSRYMSSHTWGDWEHVKDATCNSFGYDSHTCTVCGRVENSVIYPGGHLWGETEEVKAPTCTEYGEGTHTCTICGTVESVTIETKDHAFGEWVETQAPTCTDYGYYQRDCVDCGYFEQQFQGPLGHDFVDNLCTRCGAEIADHEHEIVDGRCEICGFIPVFENASVYDNDGDGVNEVYYFTPILPERFAAEGATHVWAGDYIYELSSSYVSSAIFNDIRHWYCTEGSGEYFTIKVTVAEAGTYEMAIHMRMKDSKERGTKYTVNAGTKYEYSFETSFQFATDMDAIAARENDYTMSSYMFGIFVELQAGDNYIKIEQSSKSPKCQHYRDFYFAKVEG